MSGEGAIERREVAADGVAREMVDDVALAAGRGALDELAVPAGKERVERPAAGGAVQSSRPSAPTRARQIDDVARIAKAISTRERQIARILHLLERQRLEVLVRRDRLGKVR